MLSSPTHASDLSSFAAVIEAARRDGLADAINDAPAANPVTGAYPKEPAFFFSCDAKYAGMCFTLLTSISEYSPGVRCHVHLIDAAPETELGARNIPVNLSFTQERSGLTDQKAQWAYYNAIRFVRFAEALEHNTGPLWIADVDAIVTGDIRPLLSVSSEVAFRMRPGRAPLNEQVGACLVQGSPASRDFFNHVSRFIRSRPMWWGIDQLALFSALARYQTDVELLGPDVAAVEADKPGLFWFTAGAAKKSLLQDDTQYAREFRRVANKYVSLRASSQ